MNKPLAERLRPSTLDNYVGQAHLVAKGKPIRDMLDNNQLRSMILWGPPGIGKTTLAKIIANQTSMHFFALNAIDSGVKEIRQIIDTAKKLDGAILFIDEIHRFSKSQQDALLAAVENGTITLIGATTENPSFEVISPLLSRLQVYVLQHLTKKELETLTDYALAHDDQLRSLSIKIEENEALLRLSGGDARKLYNLLELLADKATKEKLLIINNELVEQQVQHLLTRYDKQGEQHYDIVSAFIKSIRGSDPNAAIYYLARMIHGGEDPVFIARRILISASEDIGNANPNALLLANACFDAVEKIGYPECRIILSQTTVYLANSPKSNSTYTAIDDALALVKQTGDLPVPIHLRNAPTKLMKELGYAHDYMYSHAGENNFIEQEFLPESIKGSNFYVAGCNVIEQKQADFLRKLWKQKYSF